MDAGGLADDYYKRLGVEPNATSDEIKKAFHDQAKKTHPDHNGDDDEFRKVHAAYEVLGDAAARRDYDETRGSPDPHFVPDTIAWSTGRSGSIERKRVRLYNKGSTTPSPPEISRRSGTFWTIISFHGVMEGDALADIDFAPVSHGSLPPGVHRDTLSASLDGVSTALTLELIVAAPRPGARRPPFVSTSTASTAALPSLGFELDPRAVLAVGLATMATVVCLWFVLVVIGPVENVALGLGIAFYLGSLLAGIGSYLLLDEENVRLQWTFNTGALVYSPLIWIGSWLAWNVVQLLLLGVMWVLCSIAPGVGTRWIAAGNGSDTFFGVSIVLATLTTLAAIFLRPGAAPKA